MSLEAVLTEIRACRACAGELPHEPRPVVRVSAATRLLICGQAPGRRVHESGLPFDDPSGDRLRGWMGVDRETFYGHPAIGVAAHGVLLSRDRSERAATIRRRRAARRCGDRRLLAELPNVELTLLVGRHAQVWALGARAGRSMTETVRGLARLSCPTSLPLPHPSWRNTAWLKRNPWFEAEVAPYLRQRVGRDARLHEAPSPSSSPLLALARLRAGGAAAR